MTRNDSENISVRRTTEPRRFGGSPREQAQISRTSQLGLVNDVGDTYSMAYSAHQPSLSRTYDSDDDSSVDIIADMISDDELSIDWKETAPSKHTLQYHSRNAPLGCTNVAQSPIATERETLNVSSTASHKSIPKVSKSTSTGVSPNAKRFPRSKSLCDIKQKLRSLEVKYHLKQARPIKKSVTPSTNNNVVIDLKDRSSNVSSHKSIPKVSKSTSTGVSPICQGFPRSKSLCDMKHKLRSLEVKYHHQKTGPIKMSVTPSTNINAVIDLNESVTRSKPPLGSKPPIVRRTHTRKIVPLKQRIMETAGEIICINLTLGFSYLIFVLYKNSVSAIFSIS